MVERQIAVNYAISEELDRDPTILLQLEEVKLDMLANAYVTREAAGLDDPTDEEIRKFFDDNPALFKNRRFYGIREIVVSRSLEQIEDIKEMIYEGVSHDDIKSWLRDNNVRHQVDSVVRTAEQLPIESLNRLYDSRPGEVVVFESPTRLFAYEVVQTSDSPMSLAEATPSIVRHLTQRKLRDNLAWKMKKMRNAAKIEYLRETVEPAVES